MSPTFQKQFKEQLVGLIGGVSTKKIKDFSIPLPPLSEQEAIVERLDSSFAKIDAVKAKAEKSLDEAKALFQSALTEMMKPKEGWEEKKLGEVCEQITDGTHTTPHYTEQGYIFLSSKNVTNRVIDWKNVKYIDKAQHIEMHKRVSPKINDILLAKNGTTGVGAIVDKEIEFAHKMLEVNISSLRYQFMPTQMVQNIWNKLGDKFMNWVEKKLE